MPEIIPVSVVMPTYNDAEYLRQAIDSILGQTFPHFEFIIVNDGSTDDTESIILSYKDSRIKYLSNERNMGNAYARNLGMAAAKGKYIAIMDSDDISPAYRLQTAADFLDAHPRIDMAGGAAEFFEGSQSFVRYYPSSVDFTKSFLFFKNCILQGTAMIRSEAVKKYGLSYKPELENMEDYELCFRAAMAGARLMSIPEVMLRYRTSESQLSNPARLEGRNRMLEQFFRERLGMLDIHLPEDEFQLLHGFIRGRIEVDDTAYKVLKHKLDELEQANRNKMLFSRTSFSAALFFFRLRLIKYFYLEKGSRGAFVLQLWHLCRKTGLSSLLMFLKNERRNFIRFKISLKVFQL